MLWENVFMLCFIIIVFIFYTVRKEQNVLTSPMSRAENLQPSLINSKL